MKERIIMGLMLISACSAWAQAKPVKIVFDITSGDTLVHQAAIRHLSLMSSSYPNSEFELVIYGGALPMVIKDKSKVSAGIHSLESMKNVSIKVCGETMKRTNVDKSMLFDKVGVVPDAIFEIVTKQKEGWGYIKEAH